MDQEHQRAGQVCTRAHLVTDTDGDDTHRAVRVALRQAPEGPVHIMIVGHDAPGWSLPREVLEQGMAAPASGGGARVWPCGRVATVVEFHTGHSVAVLQLDNACLSRFLRRTAAAPEPAAR
ncbi:SsgA family sporulation/cell division regulator [Streptomyces sp. KLOTTS4A1]|uniref:SsgA family sporulation/cell division regulator n=1 Tax=Streptomyces sp. KLOTTS4A1 TaxID=3390996 RepID=UPI0039F4E9FF